MTSGMWMDVQFASVVDLSPIDSGVGPKNARILQWVSEPYNLPHGCEQMLLKPNTNKYSLQVREEVLRNSGLGTCGI